jgi:hypothetical protein
MLRGVFPTACRIALRAVHVKHLQKISKKVFLFKLSWICGTPGVFKLLQFAWFQVSSGLFKRFV